MRYDYTTLYNQTANFYNARPKAKRVLITVNSILAWVFVICYADLILSSSLSTKELVKIVFVPLLALFTVSVLRLAIDRPRPYAEDGAHITPLIKKKVDNNSFPSRHLACAAVIAMTCLAIRPLLGGALLCLSGVMGYTRFATGVHYPSDLFVGAGVGLLIGCFVFIL